ncbi:hypothetical protein RN001_009838 [Aquatica leii]|uniref:ER membrane protein complex subunit 1 n=1 Tax=Aquatica leii TaxID=1421715 RepID=A0AAN7P5R1_9COLE|nr:hypothetical protein RN001_009838 [Aquatica leii]
MYTLKLSFIKYLIVASFFNVSFSLYEDQIGKFDWKLNFVGNVKYGSIDSSKRLIVATEENVLASLNLKNGQIHWRQILETAPNQIVLLYVDREIITVSGGKGTWYVRGWDLNVGSLLWEWSFYMENKQNFYWILSKDQLVNVAPVIGSHLEVTQYDVRSGRNNGKTVKISTPWVSDLSRCTTAGVYWACLSSDDSSGQLYYTDVLAPANQVHMFPVQSLIGSAPGRVEIKFLELSDSNLLLIRNNAARYIHLKPDLPHVYPYSLSPKAIAVANGDQTLLLQMILNTTTKKYQIQTIELQEGTENVFEMEYNNEAGVASVITAFCKGSACRVLIKSNDNSISLLQLPGGKASWTREEALSQVVSAEFLELPLSELDASIEHEFDSVSGDRFSTFYNRIFSQIRQLLVVLTGKQGNSNIGLVRDEFGLHKVIVVVTSVGKIYALDSITGSTVWSKYLPNVQPFLVLEHQKAPLFVQRSARYSPLAAQCVVLMKDKITGHGVMHAFDPITGEVVQDLRLPYRIEQAMLLPIEDENHLKGILILSDDNEVNVYPPSAKSIILKHSSSIFLYTANSNTKTLHGYNLHQSSNDKLRVTSTWDLNLGQAELLAVNVRPSSERIHSQGRVLADRSVLYKYVNPNLLAIATLMDDPIHKHVLSIYLVDGVTGLVVYSVAHKRVAKPIHLVHSENWLVYTYYNARFRRMEMAAVELYEGATQSNSTSFSSHAVSQLPHPETQAYIFPGLPLAMQSTLTERGITNKHIIVALSTGAVTEVPWAFLEPRGPQGTMNPEEGYIPYIPELPIPAEATINYNQTIPQVRGIEVAAARLESTCLVLVYGLDLFYTRVTPSKTFDLLKEDFDHWLIAFVLIGLTAASYITKRLASRKALKQAWK